MTAIQWLLQELDKVNYHPTEAMIMYAKKLEKEQSKKDYKSGVIDGFNSRTLHMGVETDAEQYYNETYGSKGSDDHIVDTNEMVEDTFKVWECCGMENCICKGSDETNGNNVEKVSNVVSPFLEGYEQINQDNPVARGSTALVRFTSSQTEISDEEIRKAAIEYANNVYDKNDFKDEWGGVLNDFIAATKWYREQLKQRQ